MNGKPNGIPAWWPVVPSIVGMTIFSYAIVTQHNLPLPAYPLLGLMIGVLPAAAGDRILKRWLGQ